MAISTEVIRKITIQGSTQGVAQATDELNKFAAAQVSVAVVSDSTSKRALSAEAAYNRQTMSVVAGARAQADLEKALKVAQAALNQGVISADEHAKRVGLLNEKYGQLSNQQKAAGVVMGDLQGRMQAALGATGTLGAAVAALGGSWVGVVAVIGGGVLAFNAAADAAHGLAEKAQELRRFAEITGLTTAQVQALRSEASKFGVTSDEAQTGIQNFTARFNELRLGQGELLTQIRRVNPALADQMQMTTNAGDALTLFGQALLKVDDIFQRNALVKAASGKGGLANAGFFTGIDVNAITKSFTDAGRGLDEGLIKKLAQLEIDIHKTTSAIKNNLASVFAVPVLESELTFYKTLLDISKTLKDMAPGEGFKQFMDWLVDPRLVEIAKTLGSYLKVLNDNSSAAAGLSNSLAMQAGLGDIRRAPAVPLRNSGPADLNDPLRGVAAPVTATGKTLEAQVEDMKKLIAVLGPAATASEQLALKQKELELAARDAGVGAGVLQRAQAALNAEFALNRLRENTSALGAAATPLEQYTLRVAELDNKLKTAAISQETYNRAVADLKQEQSLAALQRNITALGSAATAADQYKLKVSELEQQLARGQITQQTFNRAVFEANPMVQDLKSNFGDLAKSMVASMMAGKSFTDSLSTGLKNLSARLADKSIESLLSGDFEKAAIAGASAIATFVASLFTGNSGQKLKDQIALIDKVSALQTRQIAATTDQSTLAGQLAAFDAQANVQRMMEARDGNKAIGELELTLSDERLKIIKDFNAQALSAAQQAADAQEQVMKAAQQRIQSAQDRLFNASNDPNTLEGQLAAFDRQAQADQLAERDAGGQAMLALEAAQAQERLNIIKGYNQKITDAATQAAQQQLDAVTKAARGIVDYLNNLNVGADSSLSPQARLAAAQSTYNAKLGLAQGGNADALSSITTDAENLRKAAQDFFASGSGYQNILATIKSQLLSLPAVAQSTDPVVAALRDVVAAVGVTTGAVTTGATTTTAAIGQTNALTTTSNNLQDTANGLALVANSILATQQSLLTAINTLSDRDVNAINGLGVLTASIASTHSSQFNTMISLLGAIASRPTGGGGTLWSWLGFQQGGMIPGYAGGGMIANGIWNRDSVIGRYAGGGDIALAGGEYVTRAPSVNASTLPTLRYMNDNGRPPANDNGFDGRSVANLTRVSAAGSSAIVAALREEIGALREEIARGNATARLAKDARPRPGAPQAQKSA